MAYESRKEKVCRITDRVLMWFPGQYEPGSSDPKLTVRTAELHSSAHNVLGQTALPWGYQGVGFHVALTTDPKTPKHSRKKVVQI